MNTTHNIADIRTLVLYSALIIMMPLAMESHLPAFDAIAMSFSTSIVSIQLTLTYCFLGSAIGQFIGGPLSDEIGHFKTATIGCLLFTLSSFWVTQTDSLFQLYTSRVAQGLSAGIASVIVNAHIARQFSGKTAARTMSKVTLIIMATPFITPILGLTLTQLGGWKYIFYFFTIYGLILAISAFLFFPQSTSITPKKHEDKKPVASAFTKYRHILVNKTNLLLLVAIGMNVSIYMVFSTSAAFIYLHKFSVSSTLFSILLTINGAFFIIGNRIGVFLLRKHEPHSVCVIGSRLLAFISTGLLLIFLLFDIRLPVFCAFIALIAIAIPISGPISSSIFMQLNKHYAGTASACMGIFRVSCGMLGSFLVSFFHTGSLLPVTLLISSFAIITHACFFQASKKLSN